MKQLLQPAADGSAAVTDVLDPFWKRLRQSGAKVEVVAKLMNDKLSDLRRELQRQAYGYRDQEFFRLRIFALHETRRVLVG